MRHSSKVAAAILAGSMALSALTPVAALAAGEKEAKGSTPVTVVKQNVAEDEEKNLEVLVPMTIPLAATGDDNALVGPTTAGFTNRSTKAVTLTDVAATTVNGFQATDANGKNYVELKITRATNAKQFFTLASAAKTTDRASTIQSELEDRTDTSNPKAWTLPAASEEADLIVIDSSSNIKNLNLDLSAKKQFATLNWTFTEVTNS